MSIVNSHASAKFHLFHPSFLSFRVKLLNMLLLLKMVESFNYQLLDPFCLVFTQLDTCKRRGSTQSEYYRADENRGFKIFLHSSVQFRR